MDGNLYSGANQTHYNGENTLGDNQEILFVIDDDDEHDDCGEHNCACATAASPLSQNDEEDDAVVVIDNHQSPWTLFPPAVVAILLTETAERFSYYGFRAILVLYLTTQLDFSESTAISLFAYMTSFSTLMPLFGAVISDGYLGKYLTILIFSSIYAVGIGILTGASYVIDVTFTFIGLFLICVGTGGIKPCVSPFGADQLKSISSNEVTNKHLVQKYFSYYYLGVNVGALASFLLMPSIRARFGFSAAFFSSMSFMVFSLFVFVLKKSEYVIITPGDTNHCSMDNEALRQGTKLMNVIRIYMHMAKIKLSSCMQCNRGGIYSRTNANSEENDKDGDGDQDMAQNGLRGMSQQEITDAQEALRVLPVLTAFPAFWMLYDQLGSVWTLQANNMNLHGIQPEQLGVLNPLLILVFIPLFDQHIYPWCQRRGWSIEPLHRMACGMLLIAVSFFMSGILEAAVEKGALQAENVEVAGNSGDGDSYKIDIWWQVPQILVISTAEILVSVTGLEFVYANSPYSMKSVIMAMYSFTYCIGDLFGGLLYSCLSNVSRDVLLHICGLLMLANLAVFKRFVETWWNKQNAPFLEHQKIRSCGIGEDAVIELPPLS